MKRLILVGAMTIAVFGCISEPAPWTAGADLDVQADSTQRKGDGRADVGKVETIPPKDIADVQPDAKLTELPDVTDTSKLDGKDSSQQDGPDAMADLFDGLDVSKDIECKPQCQEKECGDDGCGGICWACSGGQVCNDGLCTSLESGYVLIPNGVFTMGTPDGSGDQLAEPCRSDMEEEHEVVISRPFYMKKTEITVGEYSLSLGDNNNPSKFKKCGNDCPANLMTWFEAAAYCNWLSEKEQLETCYVIGVDSVSWPSGFSCSGYRLPTEAEWEYAARAGTKTAFYSGDNFECGCGSAPNLASIGWYCGNLEPVVYEGCLDLSENDPPGPDCGGMQATAGKSPNDWGLFDIAGGVWEWCWDWYAPYSGNGIDPKGPLTSATKVLRGGSWIDTAKLARHGVRLGAYGPTAANYLFGFRPVRTACDLECDGLECGQGFCGGDCGTCAGELEVCIDGQCVCAPACEGKGCGKNGCGGSCGVCEDGYGCPFGQCEATGNECFDDNDVPWDGCLNGKIAEFLVNPDLSGDQRYPVATFLHGGDLAVVWTQPDEPAWTAFMCILHSDGSSTGALPVNEAILGNQIPQDVVPTDQQGVVVGWSALLPQENIDLFGRRFLSDGTPVGNPFQLNSSVEGKQFGARLAATPQGYLAVWYGPLGADSKVFLREFDPAGVSSSAEAPVDDNDISGSQITPTLARIGSNEFTIVWSTVAGLNIVGRSYNSETDTLSPSFTLGEDNGIGKFSPATVAFPNGSVAVVWKEVDVLKLRVRTQQGELGDIQSLPGTGHPIQGSPAIAIYGGTKIAVAWFEQLTDGPGLPSYKVVAQMFDGEQQPLGEAAKVNYDKVVDLGNGLTLDLASDPAGGFAAVWSSIGQYGDGSGVFAQRFDEEGNKLYK